MERNCIISDDLVEEILSRLPVKDLLRFRCVSRGWCALIDDVSFIRKHYQVNYSFRKLDDNMTYFLNHTPPSDFSIDEFYLLNIQQGDALTVDLTADLKRDSRVVLPYEADQYSILCYGCVNGIICLTCTSRKALIKDSFLALWNPATREFKTIAYPNDPGLKFCHRSGIYGFGFDLSSSDFKILLIYVSCGEHEDSINQVIYSLKSDSWKQISNLPADISGLPVGSTDGYLNGVYYWVTDLPQESGRPLHFVIVSFNFTAEVFKLSTLPHDAISLALESYSYQKIALYKERLALAMSFKVQDEQSYNIHIWVATQLDDFGVPLSWEHLFNIGPHLAKLYITVDTILLNGHLHVSFVFPVVTPYSDGCQDFEAYLYNHSTGKFKKFESRWHSWFRYVESLFPLSKRLIQT
ncbi:hypothetical protein RDABS01_020413 [Bienertia sinuspersici]